MKKNIIVGAVGALLLGGCSMLGTRMTYNSGTLVPKVEDNTEFSTIADRVAPAVVGIISETSDTESIGSGVAVAEHGYVLTNAHVVLEGSAITLYLSDGSTASATLKWKDTANDIAVLQASVDLPYLPFAENGIGVGQEVLAVGTPLDIIFQHTFTKGIVSALDRTLEVSGENGTNIMHDLIQHDASINPGNSGGPLINSSGEVVGINTLKVLSYEGLGFAIPVNYITSVLSQINSGTSYATPYLGLASIDTKYVSVDRNARSVTVLDVKDLSPSALAGVRPGDEIVAVNGADVGSVKDMMTELYKYSVGDRVELRLKRDGKEYLALVELIGRPQ